MRGICGHRPDGDVLNCPDNGAAAPLPPPAAQKLFSLCPQLHTEVGTDGTYCCTEEQVDVLERQIQVASIFLLGCPACDHNFKQFFCLMTCSPDQSTFTNVTALQIAADTGSQTVEEASVFVDPSLGKALYDSCKDVVFPAVNQKAMIFVGG
jgi:Niemann-Pick C1 protein